MRSTEHLLRSPFHLLRDLDGVAVAATRHLSLASITDPLCRRRADLGAIKLGIDEHRSNEAIAPHGARREGARAALRTLVAALNTPTDTPSPLIEDIE